MLALKMPTYGNFQFLTAGRFYTIGQSVHPRRNLDSAVLLLGCSGCYPIAQDDRAYDLEEDTYLLLFPGHEHSGTAPAYEGQSHFWCHFYLPKGTVETEAESVTEGTGQDCFILPEFGRILHSDKCRILFHQLNEAAEVHGPLRESIAGIYVRLLLQTLASDRIEQEENTLKNRKKHRSALISRVKEYIRVNLTGIGSVSSLGGIFFMNSNYLDQLFKEETGQTLRRYITTAKIEIAKQLLLNTNQRISDIASEAGFHDDKYFMRVFRKELGVTPSEFRQSYCHMHVNSLALDVLSCYRLAEKAKKPDYNPLEDEQILSSASKWEIEEP